MRTKVASPRTHVSNATGTSNSNDLQSEPTNSGSTQSLLDTMRIGTHTNGRLRLERGADLAKDQSYVLHMVTAARLEHTSFPIGHMTKDEVRSHAARLGLRTAGKPDSQDVCFISRADGREHFLGNRIPLRSARVVDRSGSQLGGKSLSRW